MVDSKPPQFQNWSLVSGTSIAVHSSGVEINFVKKHDEGSYEGIVQKGQENLSEEELKAMLREGTYFFIAERKLLEEDVANHK